MKSKKMEQKKIDSSLTEHINKVTYNDIRIT